MSFGFPHFAAKKGNAFLVLRIGQEEIDFLLFQKDGDISKVLAWGSEDISHFTVWQTLEKIFLQLPKRQMIQGLIATFPENQFNAQVVHQVLPPILSNHVINEAEAVSIERDALLRADRVFQKNLFHETGILPSEFTLRRVRILERRIAGYRVEKLAGFKRGEIELSILGVFLLESPFLSLEQFAKIHNIRDIRVVHVAEAIEFFAKKHSHEGIYLDVEEEKTQLAVSNEGHFTFPGCISMGSRDFTEFFGVGLGMREARAEVFQEQYSRGELSLAVQEKVHDYLLPKIQKFGTLVEEKLSGVQVALPSSIWVFGAARALHNIKTLFSDAEFEALPFAQRPQVRFLLPREVWESKGFSSENDPKYTTLCLLSTTIES